MAKHTLQIKAMDFAALTARKGELINLQDPKNAKGMADRYRKHLGYQLNSILCIPLMHEDEAIGVLEVYNKNTTNNSSSVVFTQEDEQMLWRLSEHISIAITKLKLIRYDALTGLLRPEPFFEKCIVKLRSERKREQESDYFALVMGDVDWFKNYNDQNGHEAGNTLLRDLAYLLLSSMREKDLICRYGGEEFLFFLSGIKTYQEAVKFTERVRKKIEEHYFEHQENQPRHNLTMSFGITFFSKTRFKNLDSINKKELIKITNEADMALSDAKGLKSLGPNGKIQPDAMPEKNKICVFPRSNLEEAEKSNITLPVKEPYAKERRKSKRYYASLLVIYKNNGDSLVARTVNFSSGGVRINTPSPLDRNEPLELTLVLGSQAFECEGNIIYSQKNKDMSAPIQSGIEFKGLSLPNKKLIEEYFRSLTSDSANYIN
jgi:diguanylate cyclase (GGDEF)-like protein